MMKVLWFSQSPCSGVERGVAGQSVSGGWLVSLERELRENPEIQLEIAWLSPGNEKEDEFVYKGVRYYAIQPYRSESNLRFRLGRRFMSQRRQEEIICSRMREIVRKSCPDVIHIHGTERPFGRIEEYVDVPVVYSIQGLMSPNVEKFYSGISYEKIRKHEVLKYRIQKKSIVRDYNIFLYHAENERKFLRTAKNIMGRTTWDRRITGLLNPARRYFHVDEIMREPFYLSQWSKSSFGDVLQFVSVMSYGPYKGYETLLKTAKVLRDNAQFDFTWTVIGYEGDENYVRIAERVTRISSKDMGIIPVGRKNADEMVGIMLDADIFCHFSHIDNSPNTVCEAMLLGMPVIATNVGGTPSLVGDGVEGILVQDGEPYAFAGAVTQLVGDAARAAEMGAAARKRAVSRHDREKICRATVEVYNSIMEG